ncbi:BlaR1 family beta-lactam sensor/signal transducer [Lachnospiraceae bacterium ZAX-1]
MDNFLIRFLVCNVFISGIIGILSFAKQIFKNTLSSRMQYNLWFLLLGLLAIPFIPFRLIGFQQIFSLFKNIALFCSSNINTVQDSIAKLESNGTMNWMEDFTLSVSSETSSFTGPILFGIWIIGILAMLTLVFKSSLRIFAMKKTSLPLQNRNARMLYDHCLKESKISKNIPIYSTAFLKSPIIVGHLKPYIYLPIHIISDYNKRDLRYMILHELQHYKHNDSFANYLMGIAGILYWFNPFVWYALKEMRADREVACDTSVLKMLKEDEYKDYGNTLINFAEKVSLTPFPFATGLGGSMKQMEKRIKNIASYEKPTAWKWLQGISSFGLVAILLLSVAPILSIYAADNSGYHWNTASKNITYVDLSAYFKSYEGSFVLYDSSNNSWSIHDLEHATLRVAPNSTYKIYDALFGLEENIITPDASLIEWNHANYSFEAWNSDQTLQSAMHSSVNWYFQTIDEQLGSSSICNYIQKIGYGNENITGDFSTYWMESSLKISPIEQVELLTQLYNNNLDFSTENINAVKDSIYLSSFEKGNFYGKTGTGRVDGQDVNGWFIGYIETANNTYFFATNIGANTGASGSNATNITMSILSDMNIWVNVSN